MAAHLNSNQTLEKYTDQLYFGMLSYNPDASITGFLTRFVPVVFKKFDPDIKWAMYPEGPIEEAKHYTVTNSYIFNKHPYYEGNFKSGQLAITQKIYVDENLYDNITDIRLWFEFDRKSEAKKSF